MQSIQLIRCGTNPRLERILAAAAEDYRFVAAEGAPDPALPLLFAVAVDEAGPDEAFVRLLRDLRGHPGRLEGCVAAVIADGCGEQDTKDMARGLIFAADLAGCSFPERPLVEATGSLHNLRVTRKANDLPTLEDAYRFAVRGLLERLTCFVPPKKDRPRLLVLHASDRSTSNTLAVADMVTRQLGDRIDLRTLSLRNGTIEDCRGCSFTVCSHFAQQGACFYGGSIAQEVLPAVLDCDALLLLCPNYNDAVGANIMAFINRLTSLHVNNTLSGRSLFAIVVSGYSGGDIVAKQVLGALCLNKSLLLPPRFCMLETANDPGEAAALPGIRERAAAFAAQIRATLLP